ncbi:hypothetical protein [Sulfitobacter aestuariivivens]|uniref:DUF7742 domain-containing protein n=1 Tax=Sulfitobacter aestuariivivens TaxID=2766981 RepID=A0A927D0Q8_9RHOB|nr:hypothetical protein [Sulfitobacter aestuariivivens]MBD3662940.1 hypothetical protein [Sulfitobacter aestuariivivens]
MRSVRHSDVVTAARALLAVPAARRGALCGRILREADWADRFTRRLGKPHPLWGNGTLLAAARQYMLAPEPTFDDWAYCSAFEMVLTQLMAHRRCQAL